MSYYAECRNLIKNLDVEGVLKINDKVFYNLTFGIKDGEMYRGKSHIEKVCTMMKKDSRVEAKLLRVCKNNGYDIYQDHNFDAYRFEKGLWKPDVDYTEEMVRCYFGAFGHILVLDAIRFSQQKLYAVHIIENNIQLDIDYFKCYSFDDSKLSNDEKILARKFLAQFKNKLEKLGGN